MEIHRVEFPDRIAISEKNSNVSWFHLQGVAAYKNVSQELEKVSRNCNVFLFCLFVCLFVFVFFFVRSFLLFS